MTEGEFRQFLDEWIARRILPLGDHVDPSDRQFMANRRASELKEEAQERACTGQLDRVAEPYGGINKFVADLYRRAEDGNL